jgi:hypothetical protein
MSGWMPNRAQFFHRVLGRLRLELARALDEGHQGKMDIQRMPARQVIAELADRLKERQSFYVADSSADLAQHEVVSFVALPG